MPSFHVFTTVLWGWDMWGGELKMAAHLWHPSHLLPLYLGWPRVPLITNGMQQKGHRGTFKARWDATFPFLPWSLGMLALEEASCHGRSLTTLRPACCEEVPASHVKRPNGKRGAHPAPRCSSPPSPGARHVNEKATFDIQPCPVFTWLQP